jgi:putative acetyltransferase
MVTIRKEQPSDILAVRAINEKAFGQQAEPNIVDAIRTACPQAISLVAEYDDQLIGHILFSPVVIESEKETVAGMGLAPMSVLPEHQRRGVGGRMVKTGLDMLRRSACPFVIVLGHPAYYPRFGFTPASGHHIDCQWDGVPDEAFMVLILDGDRMKGVTGIARYRNEFNKAV